MDRYRLLLIDKDCVRSARWSNEFAKHPAIETTRCLDDLQDVMAWEEPFPFDLCLVNASSFRAKSVQDLLSWNRQAHPGCRMIVTGHVEDSDECLQLLEAGAWTCLPARASMREVMSALEAAVRGESHLSPDVAGAVLERIRWLSVNIPSPLCPSGLQELTSREKEILRLISRRMSNGEIAEELVLEVGTVKNHVHSVLKKLGVGNRYDAAAYGLEAATLLDEVTA